MSLPLSTLLYIRTCIEMGLFLLHNLDGPFTTETIETGLASGAVMHSSGVGHQLFQSVYQNGGGKQNPEFAKRYQQRIHIIREMTESTERLHTVVNQSQDGFFSQMLMASYQSAICAYFNSNFFSSGLLIFIHKGRIVTFDPTARSYELAFKRANNLPVTPAAVAHSLQVAAAGAGGGGGGGGPAGADGKSVAVERKPVAGGGGASFMVFPTLKELHAHLQQLFPFTPQTGEAKSDAQLNAFILSL